jgi:hypothetical protein
MGQLVAWSAGWLAGWTFSKLDVLVTSEMWNFEFYKMLLSVSHFRKILERESHSM